MVWLHLLQPSNQLHLPGVLDLMLVRQPFPLWAGVLREVHFLVSCTILQTRSLRDWSSDVCSSDLPLRPRGSIRRSFLVHYTPLLLGLLLPECLVITTLL